MPSKELISAANIISRLLGWIYTLSWSISFYPQPILNIRRRSVTGTAIDFPTLNVLGFFCYLIQTSTFLYSPVIRRQYAARHQASPEPTVRGNDFAFALHAVVLSVLTYTMFFPIVWGFRVEKRQRISRAIAGIFFGGILGCVVVMGVVLRTKSQGMDASDWAWIDLIYAIGYVKVFVTVFKYIPQVLLNYRRKSTVGWAIEQIILDMIGGVLSLAQLFIDSSLNKDWSGITGNPVKFLLGQVSIIFDLIFFVQHYWLYRQSKEEVREETDPLLGER